MLNQSDTVHFDPEDVEKNKAMAVLSYIWLLVFIPMFAVKDSPFTRFHVVQGFNLALGWIASHILFWLLGILFWVPGWVMGFMIINPIWWVSLLNWLVNAGLIVLSILGIINVVKGEAKELPIIGKIRIIR